MWGVKHPHTLHKRVGNVVVDDIVYLKFAFSSVGEGRYKHYFKQSNLYITVTLGT